MHTMKNRTYYATVSTHGNISLGSYLYPPNVVLFTTRSKRNEFVERVNSEIGLANVIAHAVTLADVRKHCLCRQDGWEVWKTDHFEAVKGRLYYYEPYDYFSELCTLTADWMRIAREVSKA